MFETNLDNLLKDIFSSPARSWIDQQYQRDKIIAALAEAKEA